ncbi:MAG: ligase 1 [Acidimicrobiaceae bacterium]
MLLADVVAASAAVTATASRSAKVAVLADVVQRAADEELPAVVGLLGGVARQGRIGVGWAMVGRIDVPPATEPSLTVGDLDDALDRLEALNGPGSAGARDAALTSLFSKATEAEAEFMRRLLTDGLRQGALVAVVADAVAKATGVPLAAVRRAMMLSGDLAEVARVARTEGADGLAGVGLTLLRPVLPMLAATSSSVEDAVTSCGRSSVEWKLDGARVQVHRDGDTIAVFTRNLNDVTARLPGIVELVRALPATQLVLDGEAIGLVEDERPEVFQDTMSRFGRQDGVAGAGLAARFFDILHLDGTDLLDEPLEARLAALESVVGPHRVPGIVTDDPVEAADFLAGALAAGHEGVMVKAISSTYEAGRRGGSWRKVKPVETLDLVVLAAEWGHGRRQGWLSNLHLGARATEGDGYLMVGKTFKGLTDAVLTWQTEQLLSREVERTRGTVWVRPELVVEIALDGVQRSTRYPGGVALRFARVRGYRPDKDAADADTIDTVRALLR